ncbi:hypothetical protein OAH77_04450 [Flavobacteriaceae bacterium]|nr:hypothetical protein [Flavobacteriaceae bacterium]
MNIFKKAIGYAYVNWLSSNNKYELIPTMDKTELYAICKKADETLQRISITWSTWDVIEYAKEHKNVEITEWLAYRILTAIERSHDCNYGITWDSLDFGIDDHINKLVPELKAEHVKPYKESDEDE